MQSKRVRERDRKKRRRVSNRELIERRQFICSVHNAYKCTNRVVIESCHELSLSSAAEQTTDSARRAPQLTSWLHRASACATASAAASASAGASTGLQQEKRSRQNVAHELLLWLRNAAAAKRVGCLFSKYFFFGKKKTIFIRDEEFKAKTRRDPHYCLFISRKENNNTFFFYYFLSKPK